MQRFDGMPSIGGEPPNIGATERVGASHPVQQEESSIPEKDIHVCED
jgi:hypothetical protein